jgi:LmbE family N-acetylglucosaminyl deacetylase
VKRLFVRQIKDHLKTFFRPENLIVTPELWERPPGDRVAVFAPHYDDDVIGCGGTLHKHVLAGDKVTIIYFTDGREGDPACQVKTLVCRIRKKEAVRATRLLGIKQHIFLEEPETRLKARRKLVERLAEILVELRPDLIYIPSFLENHIDHFEVNRILLKLTNSIKNRPNIAAYEVWTPIVPNVIVDITSIITKKEAALTQYESQNRQVDYVNTTLGLNRYRSVMVLQGQGYAEGFIYAPWRVYIRLIQKLNLKCRPFLDHRPSKDSHRATEHEQLEH